MPASQYRERFAALIEGKPREEEELERGLLTGIAVFQWPALVWMTVIVVLDGRNDTFEHPMVAFAAPGAVLLVNIWVSANVRNPARVLNAATLVPWGLLAVSLMFIDDWVYGPRIDQQAHTQSLGTIWPLSWVLAVALALGTWGGALAGLGAGVAAWLGELIYVPGRWTGNRSLSAVGTITLYTLGGAVVGFATQRLRQAEREISIARAREEIARTLHDGVLQTLAVVQRRSGDDELAALARDQEQELREFLFGTTSRSRKASRPGTADLGSALREAAARAERSHGIRTQVVCVDDVTALPATVVASVAGAASEALTNASKHGEAITATIFVELDETGGLFCSVKDNGRGFDPAESTEGIGTTRSIRGRLTDVGGRVEIDARPGTGAEVRMWVPGDPGRRR